VTRSPPERLDPRETRGLGWYHLAMVQFAVDLGQVGMLDTSAPLPLRPGARDLVEAEVKRREELGS
jgi:hypothetical protein